MFKTSIVLPLHTDINNFKTKMTDKNTGIARSSSFTNLRRSISRRFSSRRRKAASGMQVSRIGGAHNHGVFSIAKKVVTLVRDEIRQKKEERRNYRKHGDRKLFRRRKNIDELEYNDLSDGSSSENSDSDNNELDYETSNGLRSDRRLNPRENHSHDVEGRKNVIGSKTVLSDDENYVSADVEDQYTTGKNINGEGALESSDDEVRRPRTMTGDEEDVQTSDDEEINLKDSSNEAEFVSSDDEMYGKGTGLIDEDDYATDEQLNGPMTVLNSDDEFISSEAESSENSQGAFSVYSHEDPEEHVCRGYESIDYNSSDYEPSDEPYTKSTGDNVTAEVDCTEGSTESSTDQLIEAYRSSEGTINRQENCKEADISGERNRRKGYDVSLLRNGNEIFQDKKNRKKERRERRHSPPSSI